MKNIVYFIKNNKNNDNYDTNIIHIIEKSEFFNSMKKDEQVLLNIHLRDLHESKYINRNILEKITEKININNCCENIMLNDTLYHSKKEETTPETIISKNNINQNNVYTQDNVIYPDCYEKDEKFPIKSRVDTCDSMMVFTHFKGHSMTGFSGAVKNLVNQCTNTEGQINIHKLSKPFVSKIACLACNNCIKFCPFNSITVDYTAHLNHMTCTGCNICIESCPNDAIKLNKLMSDENIKELCEKAKGILTYKKYNKVLFINSLIKIKAYYDCNINSEKIIAEDIGILASYDPIAIDKASYDLVNSTSSEEDVFKKLWRTIDGTLEFTYGEEIGLGMQDYELITIGE